jgi:acyl-CoA thioesterase FadM
MNVQRYFAAVSDGMFEIMVRLGLGPAEIRRRRTSFAVVRAETDFHRELLAGDVVVLESTIVKLGEKSVTFQHRLKNVATGSIAMSTEFKCVFLDLDKRRATAIPDDIREAAAQLFAGTELTTAPSPLGRTQVLGLRGCLAQFTPDPDPGRA